MSQDRPISLVVCSATWPEGACLLILARVAVEYSIESLWLEEQARTGVASARKPALHELDGDWPSGIPELRWA